MYVFVYYRIFSLMIQMLPCVKCFKCYKEFLWLSTLLSSFKTHIHATVIVSHFHAAETTTLQLIAAAALKLLFHFFLLFLIAGAFSVWNIFRTCTIDYNCDAAKAVIPLLWKDNEAATPTSSEKTATVTDSREMYHLHSGNYMFSYNIDGEETREREKLCRIVRGGDKSADGNITPVEQALQEHQVQDSFMPMSRGIGSSGN